MRKTKKTKQSPSVAKAVSKRTKPVVAAPSVPAAAPIAFNDVFPEKTDTAQDTESFTPEPHQESEFPGSKAA